MLHFFVRQLSSSLFPGTVVFLVEADTGFLVASSSPGQGVAVPPDTASGSFNRIRAVEATDGVVRGLSEALVEPSRGGWGRFRTLLGTEGAGSKMTLDDVAGYFVNVRGISFQVFVSGGDCLRSFCPGFKHFLVSGSLRCLISLHLPLMGAVLGLVQHPCPTLEPSVRVLEHSWGVVVHFSRDMRTARRRYVTVSLHAFRQGRG